MNRDAHYETRIQAAERIDQLRSERDEAVALLRRVAELGEASHQGFDAPTVLRDESSLARSVRSFLSRLDAKGVR